MISLLDVLDCVWLGLYFCYGSLMNLLFIGPIDTYAKIFQAHYPIHNVFLARLESSFLIVLYQIFLDYKHDLFQVGRPCVISHHDYLANSPFINPLVS